MRLPAALVAASLVALASAQDGVPDLSGTWEGTTKGTASALGPGGGSAPVKDPLAAVLVQSGPGLTAVLVRGDGAPVDLSGLVGNGSFWASSTDPAAPCLLSGTADRRAAKVKGRLLAGGADAALDAAFRASRVAIPPAARGGAPLASPSAPVPAASLPGSWSGTMTVAFRSLDPGVKPPKGRMPASLDVTTDGADVAATLVLHRDFGEEIIPLAGRAGDGGFWLSGGEGDSPILIVGKAAGRAPRLSLKARGIFAKPNEVGEAVLAMRRSAASVLGTAAAGAPLSGAAVTLKDRAGTAIAAVAGETGAFVLDAAGLLPPFLLKADLPGGGSLYGVATEAGVANVHPLTDLILRTWYGVEGLDLDEAFATRDCGTPAPTAVEVELLESLVRRAVGKWLADAGIEPGSFDLIRSPFSADGSGFDAVLDATSVAPDGSSLTITDGTTTQLSAITCSPAAGTVTVETTVTSPAGDSASRDGTVVAFDSPTQEAVAGAMATLESFRARINSRGAALTASDLAAFATPDYLGEGLSRAQWSAQYATIFRGASMEAVPLRSVVSFDPDAGLLVLDIALTFSAAGESGTHRMRWSFRKSGQDWLLHGDRKAAEVRLGVECRTDHRPGIVDGPRRHVQVDVTPPVGTVSSVRVSGGGIFGDTALEKGSETRLETFRPTPTTQFDMEWDRFYVGLDVAEFPPPGTEFQITVTPASGPDIVYTVESGATATEIVEILAPLGNSLAVDAHPGIPLTARWTRPTTFAVERLEFSGSAYSADYMLDVPSDSPVSTASTEGTVTIPATAGGQTVTAADFYLAFEGPHGELIVVVYGFE